jgi:hypothetical protein
VPVPAKAPLPASLRWFPGYCPVWLPCGPAHMGATPGTLRGQGVVPPLSGAGWEGVWRWVSYYRTLARAEGGRSVVQSPVRFSLHVRGRLRLRQVKIRQTGLRVRAHGPRWGARYEPGTRHARDSTRLNRISIKPGAVSYLSMHWLLQGSADGAGFAECYCASTARKSSKSLSSREMASEQSQRSMRRQVLVSGHFAPMFIRPRSCARSADGRTWPLEGAEGACARSGMG